MQYMYRGRSVGAGKLGLGLAPHLNVSDDVGVELPVELVSDVLGRWDVTKQILTPGGGRGKREEGEGGRGEEGEGGRGGGEE